MHRNAMAMEVIRLAIHNLRTAYTSTSCDLQAMKTKNCPLASGYMVEAYTRVAQETSGTT